MWKETLKVRLFGLTKVPLIHWVRPRVVELSDDVAEIAIPLKRRNKNHLGSMYFGVLGVGADLGGGLLALAAMERARKKGHKISLVFKDVEGRFLRRPTGTTHFRCEQGPEVAALVDEAIETGERVNLPLKITATVPKEGPEPVAEYVLTLSLKKR
ncbi:MAG: DUF4442 domain-containing protein [Thermoplasmatota archaeon]